MKQNKCLTEREMLEDSLDSQKEMSASYDRCAGECANSQLRATFVNILSEEQDMGAQIFDAMSARGWYQTKEAEQGEVAKIRERFLNSLQ